MPEPFPPSTHHWVLPFAACAADDGLPTPQAVPPASLRHFGKLLQGMKLVHTDSGEAGSLSPPHERVLARALGLEAPDGLIPWAAWQHLQAGGAPGEQAWALITPCHWAMGREQVTMTDPAALALQEDESRALLAAMQPYFETEGITLHYAAPTRWLAQGDVFRSLPCASLDRVMGRNVAPWLPGATNAGASLNAGPTLSAQGDAAQETNNAGARKMRLLQNEMQMLLYTHAVSDARAGKGQAAVNSFWVSGSGALPPDFQRAALPDIATPNQLAQAVFSGDWPAYALAWAALDASDGARLLAWQRRGTALRLSLCGERNALTFESAAPGIFSRITQLFGQNPLPALLEQL